MSAAVGTNVGSPIAPTDTTDTYPTHDANYGKGGLMSVADTTARDAIATLRRYEGMIAYCISDSKSYQLVGGVTNDKWQEFEPTAMSMDDLTDVAIASISDNQYLRYTGSNWVNTDVSIPSSLSDMSDVGFTGSIEDGQFFRYVGGNSSWRNEYLDLDVIRDVQLTTPSDNDFLRFDGSNWVNESVGLSNLSDVNMAGAGIGSVLVYDDSGTPIWNATQVPLGSGAGTYLAFWADTYSLDDSLVEYGEGGTYLKIIENNSDDNLHPELRLYKADTAVADGTSIGKIVFNGRDTDGTEGSYCWIDAIREQASSGNIFGGMNFYIEHGSADPRLMLGMTHSLDGADVPGAYVPEGTKFAVGTDSIATDESCTIASDVFSIRPTTSWIVGQNMTIDQAGIWSMTNAGDSSDEIQIIAGGDVSLICNCDGDIILTPAASGNVVEITEGLLKFNDTIAIGTHTADGTIPVKDGAGNTYYLLVSTGT